VYRLRLTELAEQLAMVDGEGIYGRNLGAVKVHIAWGTASSTSSRRKAAKIAARLAPHDGHGSSPTASNPGDTTSWSAAALPASP
jgi:hypothetical protein